LERVAPANPSKGLEPRMKFDFFMRRVPGKNLFQYLEEKEAVSGSLETMLVIAKKIAEQLNDIHDRGWAHKDIKPANIMVSLKDHDPIITIVDVAYAESAKNPDLGDPCGTPKYMAPEVWSAREKSVKLDSIDKCKAMDRYSLGMTLLEMFIGCMRFSDLGDYKVFSNNHDAAAKAAEGGYENFEAMFKKLFRDYWNVEIRNLGNNGEQMVNQIYSLVAGLIEVKPTKRISLTKAIEHIKETIGLIQSLTANTGLGACHP
jgi:serine/threonine protein kinase